VVWKNPPKFPATNLDVENIAKIQKIGILAKKIVVDRFEGSVFASSREIYSRTCALAIIGH
jgi:hypothetical protein